MILHRFKRLFSAFVIVPVVMVGFMPLSGEPADAAGVERHRPPHDGPALDPKANNVDGNRLVLIPADGVSQEDIAQKLAEVTASDNLGEADLDGGGSFDTAMAVTTTDLETSQALAQELAAAGLVEAVEYGWKPVPMYSANPNDPVFRAAGQWALGGYPGAGFSTAWPRLSQAGPPGLAPIADLDTGFQMNHPDRCANIVAGYNYGDDNADVNPTDMGTTATTYHGTATAGVMGACTNNGTDLAGAGWDHQVRIYKISNADTKEMTDTALVNAIYGAVDDGSRVINLSLGFAGSAMPSDLKAAVDYAIAKKVVVVAAAGNYGSTSLEGQLNPVVYPAAYGPVISVAATTSAGTVATFSTHNSGVDLAAPGVGIAVLNKTSWSYQDGTSFSSPLVAAAAALLLRYEPGLTPAQVAKALTASARNVGAPGKDNYTGAGLLDVMAALKYQGDIPKSTPPAKPTTPPKPSPTPPPVKKVIPAKPAKRAPAVRQPVMQQILLSPSLTGSRYGDVVAVRARDGALMAYPGRAGGKIGAGRRLGTGFQGITLYAPGDWNGDGHNDLLGTDTKGNLYLYAGTGRGYIKPGKKIGHGWSNFTVIPAGDLTGDKNPDLLAIHKKTGFLYLYAGNGKGGFKSPYPKIGHGWKNMQVYAAGDLNRDGKNDLLAVNGKGQLFLYFGNGNGTVRSGGQIGHGWKGNYLAAGTDLNGDRVADIVGRNNKTGRLSFYRGTGGGKFAKAVQIGSGW